MSLIALIEPPVVQHGNEAGALVMFFVLLALLVAGSAWAVRRRELLLVALFAGAGLAGFVEVQLDVLSRISWATNLAAAYTAFDRRIPLFVLTTYAFVIGGGMYLTYALCARGAGRREIVRFAIAFAVLESAFEMLTMSTNWWTYYGPQPLQVFGFPLYWGAMNAAGAVGTGVLLYRGRAHFTGSRVWLAVLVPPLAFGFDFAVGWPTWDVMNTGASTLVMSLVSLVTIALCAAEVWLVSGGLTSPDASGGASGIPFGQASTAEPRTAVRA